MSEGFALCESGEVHHVSPVFAMFPGGRGPAGDGAIRSLRNAGAARRPRARRKTGPRWPAGSLWIPHGVLGKVYATADIGKPRKLKDILFITSQGRKIKLDNKEDSLIGPYEDQGFLLRGNLQQTLDELDVKEVKVNLDGAKLKWQLARE